jgi:hypothetical protein
VDTIVSKGGEKKLRSPWTLKEVMRRLDLETYEDAIFIIAFVPVSNETIRHPERRYRTQFYFYPVLYNPTKFTIIQGSSIFDTQFLIEGSGKLPLVNPVTKEFFQAVWTGDAAKLIGVRPNSGTFVLIAEPIRERYKIIIKDGGMWDTSLLRPEGTRHDRFNALLPQSVGKTVTEIGDVGVVAGDHSGKEYQVAEDVSRDATRKPRLFIVKLLGVREGQKQAIRTAVREAERRFLLPINAPEPPIGSHGPLSVRSAL